MKFLQICLREDDFLVELEKCWKMRIWTRKSASIQPRTSLGKSGVSSPDLILTSLTDRADRVPDRHTLGVKDTIETMKWTNELFHQFRKYQQISQKFENLLQINIFSVFSENFWTFREILAKIHQNFAEKWQNFEKFVNFFEKMQKNSRSFFAGILRC